MVILEVRLSNGEKSPQDLDSGGIGSWSVQVRDRNVAPKENCLALTFLSVKYSVESNKLLLNFLSIEWTSSIW